MRFLTSLIPAAALGLALAGAASATANAASPVRAVEPAGVVATDDANVLLVRDGYYDGYRHHRHWRPGPPAYGYYVPPPRVYVPPPRVYYAPPPPYYAPPPRVYYPPPPPRYYAPRPAVGLYFGF